MAEKWHKAGARIIGREQVERKLEGKLRDWDFLPMGEKIRKLEGLASAARAAAPRGEFRFLSLVPTGELRKIAERVDERLAGERGNLEDMERVFSRWGVDLGKARLRPGYISHPYGTRWWYHEGQDLLMFTSPAMARWYEKNILKRGYQPSQVAPDAELVRAVDKNRVFAFGRVHTAFKPGVADIKLVQPLVFYKALGGGLGKKGTERALPLKHPELLLLYAQLKEAEKLGASKATLHKVFPSWVESDTSIPRIYENIAKTSQRFRPETEGKTVSAVFRRKRGA
jgi:hypothetical protein